MRDMTGWVIREWAGGVMHVRPGRGRQVVIADDNGYLTVISLRTGRSATIARDRAGRYRSVCHWSQLVVQHMGEVQGVHVAVHYWDEHPEAKAAMMASRPTAEVSNG